MLGKINKYKSLQFLIIKFLLILGFQMICRIEDLHSKNIIHRDIKPENFTIGHANDFITIYLIDFGLSKEY